MTEPVTISLYGMATVADINTMHQNIRKTKSNLLLNDLLNGLGILAKNRLLVHSFIFDTAKDTSDTKTLLQIFHAVAIILHPPTSTMRTPQG